MDELRDAKTLNNGWSQVTPNKEETTPTEEGRAEETKVVPPVSEPSDSVYTLKLELPKPKNAHQRGMTVLTLGLMAIMIPFVLFKVIFAILGFIYGRDVLERVQTNSEKDANMMMCIGVVFSVSVLIVSIMQLLFKVFYMNVPYMFLW